MTSLLQKVSTLSYNNHTIVFTIIASIISATGLILNDSIPIIGSMVISPLLSPLFTGMIKSIKGGKAAPAVAAVIYCIGLIILSIVIGILCGVIYYYVKKNPEYESDEMKKRSTYLFITGSVIVAAFSGIGYAFAILKNDILIQVGFAISITIIPATVAAGLYLSLIMIEKIHNIIDSRTSEYLHKAYKSLYLGIVNTGCVAIPTYIILRIYNAK